MEAINAKRWFTFQKPADRPFRILNLGAGVQSSTLLLMACRGLIPPFDLAIFADTQYEPRAVYQHLDWLESEAEEAGIPVYRVTKGDLRQDAIDFRQHRCSSDGKRFASIPLFIRNPDGSQGRIRRQCTREYKIEPVERFIKTQVLGLSVRAHWPKEVVAEQWFGISADEARRAKPPLEYKRRTVLVGKDLFGEELYEEELAAFPARWKDNCYPLLGVRLSSDGAAKPLRILPVPLTREHCRAWLEHHYPSRKVPRSACIGCPYRSNAEWREMRESEPEAWADAIEFDHALRVANTKGVEARKILVGVPFVHRRMVPLAQVDFHEDDGRLFNEECEGICGL
jgi:hypothetical protein